MTQFLVEEAAYAALDVYEDEEAEALTPENQQAQYLMGRAAELREQAERMKAGR